VVMCTNFCWHCDTNWHLKCRVAFILDLWSMCVRRNKAARSELWFQWNFMSRWRMPRRIFWRHNVHWLLRYIGM
jgi:hypothetical protein